MSGVNEHLLFVSKHEIILSDRFWNFFFFENWEDKKKMMAASRQMHLCRFN